MSTQGTIGIKKNGSFKFIYSEYDGYLEHMGVMLNTYYNTIDRVEKLIDLGDVFSVGPHLENNASKDEDRVKIPMSKRGVVAYYRDREYTSVPTDWEEVEPKIATDVNNPT